MNRRQVLFGAGATALVLGGFVPMASAGPVGGGATAMFQPFSLGIRGSYTLNGSATLLGQIIPLLPMSGGGAVSGGATVELRGRVVQGSATPAPEVVTIVPQPPAAPQYLAPARAPTMSIVRVPRGSAGRTLSSAE